MLKFAILHLRYMHSTDSTETTRQSIRSSAAIAKSRCSQSFVAFGLRPLPPLRNSRLDSPVITDRFFYIHFLNFLALCKKKSDNILLFSAFLFTYAPTQPLADLFGVVLPNGSLQLTTFANGASFECERRMRNFVGWVGSYLTTYKSKSEK